jgi:hypothetical protein
MIGPSVQWTVSMPAEKRVGRVPRTRKAKDKKGNAVAESREGLWERKMASGVVGGERWVLERRLDRGLRER